MAFPFSIQAALREQREILNRPANRIVRADGEDPRHSPAVSNALSDSQYHWLGAEPVPVGTE